METSGDGELEALFRRIDLTLTQEELEMVTPVFEGFLGQLRDLHSLDLEGEEVQGGFNPQPG